MFHGPQTAPGNVPTPRGPVIPGVSPNFGPVAAGNPPSVLTFSVASLPDVQRPSMQTPPPGKATMFHGPHTAQPGSVVRPTVAFSAVTESSRATMFHGPHTAGRSDADPAPTPAPDADCKAPYQIGTPSASSSGTCIQYRDIFTSTKLVDCNGCAATPKGQAKPSTSSTALIGFGGLFGPGPMVVSTACV
jgi:hypothetical protein